MFGITNVVANIKGKLKYPEDMTPEDKLPIEENVQEVDLRKLIMPTEHDE